MRKFLLSLTILAGSIFPAFAGDITGAGSTFAAPLYSKWGEASKDIKLNYQAIGSGAGINQIINRTVDFGATDMPLSPTKLKDNNLFQFPTAIGAVVVIVNIPGVEMNTLKLTGDILSDIYLGKITKWNDERIVNLNKNISLPNLTIAPIYRADGSGTTFVFTDYLSKISETWKNTIGAATSVKWTTGNGAKGNDGISSTIKSIKGGIGYVESAYAEINHLTTVQLQNHDGIFVSPNKDSFQFAASNADWTKSENFAANLNNLPGNKSWPIESATFVLLPTNPTDGLKNNDVKKLFNWAFINGDVIVLDLNYVPLPNQVKEQILKSEAWK